VLAADSGGPVLFSPALTRDTITLRYANGAHVAAIRSPAGPDDGLLFRVRADGSLCPVTHDGSPPAEPGDTLIVLR
jgi:hypothetical protein